MPVSVSIVENKCDYATNNLRVIFNRLSPKHKFGVCFRAMHYPSDNNISARWILAWLNNCFDLVSAYFTFTFRLAEWIELVRKLGAETIFLYTYEIHSNIAKVIDYYVEKGYVEVIQTSLPGNQPNMKILQHLYMKSKMTMRLQQEQVIPLNDCLYRNMYRFEYIALMDNDEVIMPVQDDNWADLMTSIKAGINC